MLDVVKLPASATPAAGRSRWGVAERRARVDRVWDVLEGLSVGDALGRRFAAAGAETDARLAARVVPPPPWRWSDDTVMAVSVADVLARADGIDQDDLAEDLASRWEPDRGFGPASRELLLALRAGGRWWVLAPAAYDGEGSYGAGAAARAAPIGAWWADDLEAVVDEAEAAAEVTHAHDEGVAGSVAVAVAAALATRRGGDALAGSALLAEVASHLPTSRVADHVETAAILGPDADPARVADRLGAGTGSASFDVVPFALWAAARSLADWPEAVWTALVAPGDRDTRGAIAGAVVAARTGRDAVPAAWREARERLPRWLTVTRYLG
jgi:ADP-ribosylglycohydrolase